MSENWIKENVEYIGKIVVFYVPSSKINHNIRSKIHDFFVSKHNAYTHECGEITGYWSHNNLLIEDKHERFEISLKDSELSELINFLTEIGNQIEEKSIYLVVGEKSYLIKTKYT